MVRLSVSRNHSAAGRNSPLIQAMAWVSLRTSALSERGPMLGNVRRMVPLTRCSGKCKAPSSDRVAWGCGWGRARGHWGPMRAFCGSSVAVVTRVKASVNTH